MSDELVESVRDELDPTPATEVEWPVSRRRVLHGLAATGALALGPGAASGAAGTGIADEAYFSNYGAEATADGWDVTIDGNTFGFDGDDTIALPGGGAGAELVTPDGAIASEVIAPDGSVVFDSVPIPDSGTDQFLFENFDESQNNWENTLSGPDMTTDGLTSDPNSMDGEGAVEGDGNDNHGVADVYSLGSSTTGAVVFIIQLLTNTVGYYYGRRGAGDSQWGVRNGGFGADGTTEIFAEDDNGNRYVVGSDVAINDGDPHTVLINKPNDNPSDAEFYVDSTSPVNKTVHEDQGFDSSNFSATVGAAFFAENADGFITSKLEMGLHLAQFKDDVWTSDEIDAFMSIL